MADNKKLVEFGKEAIIYSKEFGEKPIRVCLKFDKNFIKSGVHYISVLSPLAQAIYKKSEGEEIEYFSQGEKQKVQILKI